MFYRLALIRLFFYAGALFTLGIGGSLHPYPCHSLATLGKLLLCLTFPWHWAGTAPATAHGSWKSTASPDQSSAELSCCSQSYLDRHKVTQAGEAACRTTCESPSPLAVLCLRWWSEWWEFIVQLCASTLLHAEAEWSRAFTLIKLSKCVTEHRAFACLGTRPQKRFHQPPKLTETATKHLQSSTGEKIKRLFTT